MEKFEIYKDLRNEYRFRLKARNGEIILRSEGYTSKANCEKGIASVKTNGLEDKKFERFIAKDGSPYFNLKAGNGLIIGTSETYSSKSAMENGIASVKNNAPSATVEDLIQSLLDISWKPI